MTNKQPSVGWLQFRWLAWAAGWALDIGLLSFWLFQSAPDGGVLAFTFGAFLAGALALPIAVLVPRFIAHIESARILATWDKWVGRILLVELTLAVLGVGFYVSPFNTGLSRNPLVIASKSDQPGTGATNAAGDFVGVDPAVGRIIGAALHRDVTFITVTSDRREHVLMDGEADLVIATYSINSPALERKQVAFVGPYLNTQQGVMVRSNSPAKTPGDLSGKTVCAASGSNSYTALNNLVSVYHWSPQQGDSYMDCVQRLSDGRAAAVSTDMLILVGYSQTNPDYRVIDEPFGDVQQYGIALRRNYPRDCDLIKDALVRFLKDTQEWQGVLDQNIPGAGDAAKKPRIDDVASTRCLPGQV